MSASEIEQGMQTERWLELLYREYGNLTFRTSAKGASLVFWLDAQEGEILRARL